MTIIGIGGLERDPACSVLLEGRLVAAVEQKKVARRSGPGDVPKEAIAEALQLGFKKIFFKHVFSALLVIIFPLCVKLLFNINGQHARKNSVTCILGCCG